MNYLLHYGVPRRSGRYPFGSGERPFQGIKGFFKKKAIKKGLKAAVKSKTSSKSKASSKSDDPQQETKIKENAKEVSNRRATRRNIRTLSNEEIQRNIQRLRDEKTLKDLLDADINPGKKTWDQALNVIKNSALSVGGDVAKGALKYAIKTSLTGEERSTKDLAETIWPSSNKKKKNQQQSDDDD